MNDTYPFYNTPLLYPYDALEPYIDTKTMELHHNRHLQTYIDNLNKILEENPRLQSFTLKELLSSWCRLPPETGIQLRNNAGGVFNHRFYFNSMGPASKPYENNFILKEIKRQFNSYDNFKNEFKKAGLSVFGSGYAWLAFMDNKLLIIKTANQNTPDLSLYTPVINLDVWEHAYYLKHYNLRAAYIDDWFNVIDWNRVDMRYKMNY